MEAELYEQELGNEGESLATTGKGALIGAQDFEEVIRDIDEAIQFGIKSSTPTEVNPHTLLVQEESLAVGGDTAERNEGPDLESQELEVLGDSVLGIPCTKSHAAKASNLDGGSTGVTEGGSKGLSSLNNNLKGMCRTQGRPRSKKGDHVRVGLKTSGRGKGQKVGGCMASSSNEIDTSVESGSKRKGGAGYLHVDIEEGGEKRLKIDEVSSHLSVSMALNSTSAEVAEQPRREI